jgi:hypothetical protein
VGVLAERARLTKCTIATSRGGRTRKKAKKQGTDDEGEQVDGQSLKLIGTHFARTARLRNKYEIDQFGTDRDSA